MGSNGREPNGASPRSTAATQRKNRGRKIMGITRTVLGAVAAAGIARLLAPKETDKIIETAKRAVSRSMPAAKRKARTATKAVGSTTARTAARANTAAKAKVKSVGTKSTRAVKSAVSKTKKAAKHSAREAPK
jgi:hypothetical protein